jgi:hypothetical protein
VGGAGVHLCSFAPVSLSPDAVVTSDALADELAADLAALTPLVRWLNQVLGYRPARSRY